MTEVTTDDHGRITLPKKTRERYGNRFRLVELESEIKHIPIDDPIEGLREAVGDAFERKSVAELKNKARESAAEQVRDRQNRRSEE